MITLYVVRNEIEWNYLMDYLLEQGTHWWNRGKTALDLNSVKYDKFKKGVIVFANNTAVWKHHINEKRYISYPRVPVKQMMKVG